jgi:hypothetical protein
MSSVCNCSAGCINFDGRNGFELPPQIFASKMSRKSCNRPIHTTEAHNMDRHPHLWTSWLAGIFLSTSAFAGQTIDVTTKGATPDDDSDDLAAINAAINDAKAGDTVLLPAGVYRISGMIRAKSGVNIIGAHRDNTVIRYVGSTLSPMIGIDEASDITISTLTLDGTSNNKAAGGITASDSSKLNLSHLKIVNFVPTAAFGPSGVYFSTGVTQSTIADSIFSNIGVGAEYGSGIRMEHGSSHNQVLRNTINTTGRGGIFGKNSSDLVIKNNAVSGSGGTGLGIEVQGSPRALIEDNKIDHWLSVDASPNSAIRRNTVSDKTGSFKFAGLELVNSADVVFSGNTVDGGAKIGISISGSGVKDRVLWKDNVIRSANTWAIQIQGEAGGVRRQFFINNTFADTDNSQPNPLYNNQGHGVRFNGNVKYVEFHSNTITGNGDLGVQIGGGNIDSLSFVNNTITHNGGSSVSADPVTNLEWANNTVANNGSNAQLTTSGFAGQSRPTGTVDTDPASLHVGVEATFTLSFADSDGGTLAGVLWDFGHGLPAIGAIVKHTWDEPGTYPVTVVAWDDDGRAMHHTWDVHVSALPDPGAATGAAVLVLTGLTKRPRR